MPHPDNRPIARVLRRIAGILDLLELDPKGFRVRAFATAADSVRAQPRSLVEMVREKEDLTTISDVGPAIANTIEELVRDGSSAYLKELEQEPGAGLVDALRISGMGVKKVRALRVGLELETLSDLRAACEDGRVAGLKGFSQASQAKILERLDDLGGQAS